MLQDAMEEHTSNGDPADVLALATVELIGTVLLYSTQTQGNILGTLSVIVF